MSYLKNYIEKFFAGKDDCALPVISKQETTDTSSMDASKTQRNSFLMLATYEQVIEQIIN